jgi:hypothetical protein
MLHIGLRPGKISDRWLDSAGHGQDTHQARINMFAAHPARRGHEGASEITVNS